MSKVEHRYRQVHLDFHTSSDCHDVGAEFDPKAFAETVKMGRVDSMTVFAKCHHGFSYYPTEVGTTHPHLVVPDLMGQQIEALHSAGIRAPIYVSIMWDDLAGEKEPGWVIAREDGSLMIRPPLSAESPLTGGWGWTTLDVSSAYGDYLVAQTQEICDRYGEAVDGFFFDICFPIPNYSPWGQARMREAGVRLDDEPAVLRFAEEKLRRFLERMSEAVRAKVPDATVFYNGTVNPRMAETLPHQTHFEIESLPTSSGLWGYLHYPVVARQARTYGRNFLGMTGRFHKAWADFGGLKTRDQLDYECGTVVAAGGEISVGDQLHPSGVLDPAVYRLLGHSFGRIEELEPLLRDAKPAAEVAILSAHEPSSLGSIPTNAHVADVDGAAQLFLEAAIQFDIVDPESSFDRYKALVLPDGLGVDAELRRRLQRFLSTGGRLVVSGTAALDPGSGEFTLDGVPVAYEGPAPTVPSYLHLDETLAGDTELTTDYDYVFYNRAHVVRPLGGAVAHGELRRALFNRTWEHFTSHAQAPVGESLGSPLVAANESILYFAAPLFGAYRDHDYWAYREMALNALRGFLPQPLLKLSGPGWVEATLHEQSAGDGHPKRRIVHLVAYHPRRTTQPIQHVDRSWETAGLGIGVLADGKPVERVYLAPAGEEMDFEEHEGYVRIGLPPIGAHAVVVVE
ncbi:MAG: GH151 / GH29 [uncultured Rubrobacteraceae bacterium]|uniref:GH151 / GH29 n=1 Tax=uncultured Rubrobacteraceae bacterium TaxID=349277 RepID=A0A6N3IXB8_9ACTN|nr:MAG: GH151 / GH29 [uncultured Rubrobacteraceae bacterium]